MPEQKQSVASALLAGAAGTVGTTLALWFMGWLSPFWSFVHQALSSLWTHLMAQSQWPNWSAYLVSLLAALFILTRALRYLESRNDSHARFKRLNLFGVDWHWRSMSDLPHGLIPRCPACKGTLVHEETGGMYSGSESRVSLFCERCDSTITNKPGSYRYLKERVTREIDRLLHTGEWRQHIDAA